MIFYILDKRDSKQILTKMLSEDSVKRKSLVWNFEKKETADNFVISKRGQEIEFKGCSGDDSSIMQTAQPIPRIIKPVSFKVKILDPGANKQGHGMTGIEIGLTKKITEEECRLSREDRMKLGLWYDPFNGGVYNNHDIPKLMVKRSKQGDVVDWQIQRNRSSEGKFKTVAVLFLNEKRVGKSFSLEDHSFHPTINIASPGAKVQVEVKGVFNSQRSNIEYSATFSGFPESEKGKQYHQLS